MVRPYGRGHRIAGVTYSFSSAEDFNLPSNRFASLKLLKGSELCCSVDADVLRPEVCVSDELHPVNVSGFESDDLHAFALRLIKVQLQGRSSIPIIRVGRNSLLFFSSQDPVRNDPVLDY